MPRPAGHQLAQGRVCKILDEQEVKPHKLRYYLERRDTEFAEKKMAEVLCVYRTVKLLKETAAASKQKPSDAVAIIYDEKPGIQAIATTSPDLPPRPMSPNKPSQNACNFNPHVKHGTTFPSCRWHHRPAKAR